ncbi:MAG: hypothetical protein U0R44_04595 [Candidatus Micrarchaeia archaeon]
MRSNIALFMLLILSLSFAENYVVVNSMDGRDVLSGVFYSSVKGIPVRFMPVPGGNPDIIAAKAGQGHSILLVESKTPVSAFVKSALEGRNNTVEVFQSSDGGATNLEFARRSGASGFIVVDSAFSDSALSVMPYAAFKRYYVILADKNNIADVKSIVSGKKVLIFGYVDQAVRDALAPMSPEVIGKGEDKFEDNVLIAKRHLEESGSGRALVVDGTFIEESMAQPDMPVILSGRLVPEVTYGFIKDSVRDGRLKSVMLLGNDLTAPIYDARQKMIKEFSAEGLNRTFGITVKFAQVIPSAGSGVLNLDTFRMPAYKPALEIKDVQYNRESGNVTLSIDNVGEGAAYYNVELRVKADGQDVAVFGGDDIRPIERGEVAGIQYPVDLSKVQEGNITYSLLVKYGSSKSSLEEFAKSDGGLAVISYKDNSSVIVQSGRFDKGTLLVTIKNNGTIKAYIYPKVSLFVNGEQSNISSSGTKAVDPGSLIVVEFPLQLSAEDLSANRNMTVFVDYGGREGFLTKKSSFVVPLESSGEFPLLLVAAAIAVIAIAYFLFARSRK